MGNEMADAKMDRPTSPVGRLKGTGIKLKVVNMATGELVNYGIQLNNTTLEIEALPGLEVTVEKNK